MDLVAKTNKMFTKTSQRILGKDGQKYLPLIALSLVTVTSSLNSSSHPYPSSSSSSRGSTSTHSDSLSSFSLCEEKVPIASSTETKEFVQQNGFVRKRRNTDRSTEISDCPNLSKTELNQYKSHDLYLHGRSYNVLIDKDFPENHHAQRNHASSYTATNGGKIYRASNVIVGYGVAGAMALQTMKYLDPSVEVLIIDEKTYPIDYNDSSLADVQTDTLKAEKGWKEIRNGQQNIKKLLGQLFTEKEKSLKESIGLKHKYKNEHDMPSQGVKYLDNTSVTKIDLYKKILYTKDNDTIYFDKCLLTIGSAPPLLSASHIQDPY